jgi:hypothetical protein
MTTSLHVALHKIGIAAAKSSIFVQRTKNWQNIVLHIEKGLSMPVTREGIA